MDSKTTEMAIVDTGDKLPVLSDDTIRAAADYFRQMERLKTEVMRPGQDGDYWQITGTHKPTLLKSGAEKLAFAFKFAATYEILDQIEDHHKTWDYQIPKYERGDDGRRQRVGEETKQARGFFWYKVRCKLIHRPTGELAGDCIASQSSDEPGKQDAPANTILKLAQKRAYVGAVKEATFTSNVFTQDLEDAPDSVRSHGGDHPASDKQLTYIKKMAQSNKVPDDIKKAIRGWLKGSPTTGEASDWITTLKDHIESGGRADDDNSNGKTAAQLMKEIDVVEQRLVNSGKKGPSEIESARKATMGKIDLNECKAIQLKNHLEWCKEVDAE